MAGSGDSSQHDLALVRLDRPLLQEDWGLGSRAAISPVCLPAKLYKDDDNIAFTLGTGLKYKVLE